MAKLIFVFRISLGSDAEDAVPRPRPRPVRDEGELSDSDLNFYKQQLQAPRGRKSMEKGETDYGPVVCKGIDCYRCGAAIPECEGVCPKCGTWCQRQGGPCNACRDVCESCGKPKYRCSSVGENPEESEDDKEIEDLDDSNGMLKLQKAQGLLGHVKSREDPGAQRNRRQRRRCSCMIISFEV